MNGFLQTFLRQFQHLKIQLEEIRSATNNFDDQNNLIGVGGFGRVYRGEVSHYGGRSMVAIKRLDPKGGQGMPEFLKEITMLSNYKNENIISLLGFCCEGPELILVYEHASCGSLDRHLNSHNLSWKQRLKICLDVAKGLSYLHDPNGKHQRLIHSDIKSGNILLDDQWNAKVSDFGLSIMGSANEQQSVIVTLAAGTHGYCDPQYVMTHTLTKESDVYSFGVVLFEVLCGTLCYTHNNGRLHILVPTWIESYKQKTLNNIIYKNAMVQLLDQSALETISGIAYRCLNTSREDRPNMSEVVTELESALKYQEFSEWILLFDADKMTKTIEPPLDCSLNGELKKLLPRGLLLDGGNTTFFNQFQYLKIHLEEITAAVNFNDAKNCIGIGGTGKLYKGEMTHSKGKRMVAIKRLERGNGQGTPKFLKEILTLSRYRHKNLISLIGFCCEGPEMILVYEHATHGSLDHHLNSPHLTWTQRLKICLDIGKGLSYLHHRSETNQRLIHCDIKSTKILLDDQWNAKVSDFGKSLMGSAKEHHSAIVTLADSIGGYCDPQYSMTQTITEKSDIYSLGVVLLEVLCGRLCYTHSHGHIRHILVPTWTKSYKQKNLKDIIFKNATIQPLDQNALETFSGIVYRCLNESREDQPLMVQVVTELKAALKSQKFSEWEPSLALQEIITAAEPPLEYRSNGELRKLLSEGVLLNCGNTWLSLDKNGEHCEMISIAECCQLKSKSGESGYNYISRFAEGLYFLGKNEMTARVKTQFLSPGITYTVNLVFKFYRIKNRISLRYKLQGETETAFSNLACQITTDGRWMCELYQFTCDHRIFYLEFLFYDEYPDGSILVEGIQFLPLKLKKVEYTDEKHSVSDSDVNWERKMPTDYEEIMERSKNSTQCKTKKEAYSILCQGLLIDNGNTWFYLDKNGKKCHMLSARTVFDMRFPHRICLSPPESRFRKAIQPSSSRFRFQMRMVISCQLISSQTTYAIYLVYQLPKITAFKSIIRVQQGNDPNPYRDIYLVSPQTPVIRPKADQNTHNPVNRPQLEGLPKQREDGSMEVQIWEFRNVTNAEGILINFNVNYKLDGLIIEGVEVRPM